jgi:hypothetical protein
MEASTKFAKILKISGITLIDAEPRPAREASGENNQTANMTMNEIRQVKISQKSTQI